MIIKIFWKFYWWNRRRPSRTKILYAKKVIRHIMDASHPYNCCTRTTLVSNCVRFRELPALNDVSYVSEAVQKHLSSSSPVKIQKIYFCCWIIRPHKTSFDSLSSSTGDVVFFSEGRWRVPAPIIGSGFFRGFCSIHLQVKIQIRWYQRSDWRMVY